MLPNVGRLSCHALRCKRANLARLSEDAKLSRSNPGARAGDHRRSQLARAVAAPAHALEGFGGLCIRVRRIHCYRLSHVTAMFWFFPPSKKPTPSEYAVLVVFICVVFLILGVVALVIGFRAPAEKHDLAVALEVRGAWCLGIGVAIAITFWLFNRMVD